MALYTRTAVLDGGTLDLKAVFVDDANNFINPVSPQVYIYSSDIDVETINAEIDASTFTSALAGPLTPTQLAEGFYELVYTVPADSPVGLWYDVWVGAVNSTVTTTMLSFTVVNGINISEQKLFDNELIVIELDQAIASYSGLTLADDIQLSFLTTLKPFYASPDLIRMEIGPWLDFIPDSTLALMAHWSSKEADFIKAGPSSSAARLQFARAKFVMYDAALRALYLPGASLFQPHGGLGASKRLGDLAITNTGSLVARTSSGIDTDTLGYIKKQRDEWWRVVNFGATIMPGQSAGVVGAVRGKFDPNRRLDGRGYVDPDCTSYAQPALNSKYRPYPGARGKAYFRPSWSSRYI